ncbi:pyridoxamine 5'-phosphate oxidase family protein [Agrococcus sp. HG114]|uniref:pyridoxamine 5'-phosphate oxidase family protein n=1 Tax=Agrococcus sp. HG114 TaxID=2969757 RepID=UPI00215AA88C|nr:pyridoxamine 5'-phosphate oxidase family protein [Agrococcus sp. HG114]MCR8671428.1 pyridoxamine 5'-phosphate oxidase family protein [Agrococcus sp. HG114]
MTTALATAQRAAAARVVRQIRREHFAVLATSGETGAPHSAGVCYGAARDAHPLALYVMTRLHLLKARDVARDPRVSLVIPVPRRVLSFLPPATVQVHGTAEILRWDDAAGRAVFSRFWMGRRILEGYDRARAEGEQRVCFLRIALDDRARSYLVGHPIWQARRDMEAATERVSLAAAAATTPERAGA